MSGQTADERIERAERCAAQFEVADALVLVVGDDRLVVYLSAGWERVFDSPVESLLGRSLDAILSDSRVQLVDARMQSLDCNHTPGANLGDSVLLRHRDPEAGFVTLEGYVACVLAESTDRLMIFRDVSENWLTLSTLVESERRFRWIAEATRDMVTETDQNGRFAYVSAACETVLGYKPDELVGTDPLKLHHPDEIGAFLDTLREGARSDEPFAVPPHRLFHRDGSAVWVEAVGLIYRDAEGARKTLGVARDVTPQFEAEVVRRNLEERVLRSQKLESLGTLAGGVAHDFNNLLTPIIGNAGLVLLDLPAESPIRKRIEMIRVAANRATALTRQMLAYAGHGVPSVDAVNITTTIEQMALLLETTTTKATEIVYDLQGDLPFIEVDETHVGQVAMNLVANASESFPKSGGRIEIRTGSTYAEQAYLDSCSVADELEKGQYVYLEVCDNGPGIPVEDRGRIFDPFFTTRFTGRGLGLAAVDGIVRGYKGALELTSEVGHGTRIRVLFPVPIAKPSSRGSSETRQVPAPERTDGNKRGMILVVDDDEDSCELMAAVLGRADFKVLQASGGAGALKLYQRYAQQIDGVVLDYTMPLVSGAEVFDAIRSVRPDARVIMVSGYTQARSADELMQRGLFAFLQKPFSPTDLLREVGRLIDA